MIKQLLRIAPVAVLLATSQIVMAQTPKPVIGQANAGGIPIPSMLFLTIAPDARSAAMGDAGSSISPSAYSVYWNPAQTVFAENTFGGALSYTPWLRNLGVDDMALYNFTGYYKSKGTQAFGLMVNYFNQGNFQNTSQTGQVLGTFSSREYAVTGSYSRKMSDKMSIGVNLKYINSDIFGGAAVTGVTAKPASTVAADLAAYWKPTRAGKKWQYSYAVVLSNIGGKISYGGVEENFIPTNLKFGLAGVHKIDDHNSITLTVDFNKLMIPTPTADGTWKAKSSLGAIFSSLGDAPGGFSEELKEITTSLGAEYNYNQTFFLRAGYFYETEMKGNRKFFSAGLGVNLDKKYGLDFAYLLPTTTDSPLANTLRFTLHASLDSKKESGNDKLN